MFVGRRTTIFLLSAAALAADTKVERTDLYGEPLPNGAIARLGPGRCPRLVLAGTLAFSPDGSLLASGEEGGAVRVWELPSGRLKERYKGITDAICTVAFLDRGIVASGYNDGMIQLWDVIQARELRTFGKPKRLVRGFGICPHRQLLASANEDDGIVRLWDAKTGQETSHFQAQRGSVGPVAFSPRGNLLATLSGKDQTSRLWDVATGRELKRFSTWGSQPVAFSPDGRILALRTKDGIQLMDIATGRERLLFWEPSNHNPNELAFSPDGKMLASAGVDGTALIWDVTGRCPDGDWKTHDLRGEQIESYWQTLGGEDAAAAHRAVWALAAAPRQTVPFFREHLRAAVAKDTSHLSSLVADLENDQFAVREAATRDLEAMGEAAEPALRKVLAGNPTLELRRRVEPILKNLNNWPTSSSAALREWRALEVLEHLGKPEARKLLQKLADGAPEARLTQEAKAALQRVAARRENKE